MAITVRPGSGIPLRGPAGGENPTFTSVSDPEITDSGTSSQVTVSDAILNRSTGASTRSRYRCEGGFTNAPAPVYSTSDPSIATIDSEGVTTFVSAGTATVRAETDRGTVGASFSFQESTGVTVDALSSWVSGSLALEASGNIDAAVSGISAATAKPIFSEKDNAEGSYLRNIDCWASPWVEALTCISPWNSYRGEQGAGTLITPRHMIGTIHFRTQTGATVRFVSASGEVHDRTILGSSIHPSYSNFYPDIAVYILSSDLPSDIIPCKIPPATLADHFGNLEIGIPSLVIDQEQKALVSDLYSIDSRIRNKTPTDPDRLSVHEELISGDSSGGGFLIIGDDLVLNTTWTYGGPGAGTYFGSQLSEIADLILAADAIAGVSTGHLLSTIDLSGYPTYA